MWRPPGYWILLQNLREEVSEIRRKCRPDKNGAVKKRTAREKLHATESTNVYKGELACARRRKGGHYWLDVAGSSRGSPSQRNSWGVEIKTSAARLNFGEMPVQKLLHVYSSNSARHLQQKHEGGTGREGHADKLSKHRPAKKPFGKVALVKTQF